MSNEFKHDEQLKKWLKQVHQDVEIPDGTQSWLKVKSRLDAIGRRKRRLKRLQIVSLIACASLLLSFALSMDLPKAYSQFSGLVKKAHENIVNIFFQEPVPDKDQNAEAKTSPPPPNDSAEAADGLRMEDVSLEEAQAKLLFPLAVPGYTPQGYDLDIVRIFRDADGEYRTVFLEYVNGDGRIIQHNQRLLRDEAGPELSTVHESSTIKDVMVKGYAGVMITHDNHFIQLEWLTGEAIKHSLFGLLPESELLSMAESLQ